MPTMLMAAANHPLTATVGALWLFEHGLVRDFVKEIVKNAETHEPDGEPGADMVAAGLLLCHGWNSDLMLGGALALPVIKPDGTANNIDQLTHVEYADRLNTAVALDSPIRAGFAIGTQPKFYEPQWASWHSKHPPAPGATSAIAAINAKQANGLVDTPIPEGELETILFCLNSDDIENATRWLSYGLDRGEFSAEVALAVAFSIGLRVRVRAIMSRKAQPASDATSQCAEWPSAALISALSKRFDSPQLQLPPIIV